MSQRTKWIPDIGKPLFLSSCWFRNNILGFHMNEVNELSVSYKASPCFEVWGWDYLGLTF